MLQASQSQNVTWVNFAIEAVKIMGPAIITGVITWVTMRYQIKLKDAELQTQMKLKDAELQNQSRLKARELMFAAYQQKMEQFTKAQNEVGATLGKLHNAYKFSTDKAKRDEAKALVDEKVASYLPILNNSVSDLERELKEQGLTEKYKNELASIKELYESDNSIDTDEGLMATISDLLSLITKISSLQNILLERRRINLFREYLPPFEEA